MRNRWTHHPLPGGWTLATRPTLACGEAALVAIPTPPGGDPDAAPASHGYVLDDAPEPLAALLGTVAAEVADGSAPVRYGAPAPADAPRSAPGCTPPFVARAATTGDLFAGAAPDRTFAYRSDAVRHARQLSERGTPCDVYDAADVLIYTRAMDVALHRAQLGLFS